MCTSFEIQSLNDVKLLSRATFSAHFLKSMSCKVIPLFLDSENFVHTYKLINL